MLNYIAVEGGTNTTFSFSYDGMNRISGYNKTITEVGAPPQSESWNFYYGPIGIDNAERFQNSVQNLTIDYSTDTNGRILSATYNETGGYKGNLIFVYDNYGNMLDLLKDDGNPAKAILINPNNGTINKRYDPYGIDDPYSYRARDGFIDVGDLWAGGDGTVYIQGHPVIPDPWGNVSINKTDTATTTYTTDITDKGGRDDAEPCGPGGCAGNCVDYDNMNCDQIKREIEKGNCKPCGRGGDACRKVDECSNTVDNILKDWCHIGPVTKECYEKYNSTGMTGRSLGITNDINDKSNKYYKDAKNAFRYAYDKIGCSEI